MSAALGPLIGGWVTANYTWRIVFAGETVVVLVLMLFLRAIPAMKGRPAKLDIPGAILSAAGLGLAVFGVLRSSQWGWLMPKAAAPVAPLGLSPVIWLIGIGVVLLGLFARREEAVMAAGGEPLLDMRLLKVLRLRAGLTGMASQQFMIMGIFFVLPLCLQTVLGFDSSQTGITILPLSLSLFACALLGASLTTRISPRRIIEIGLTAMLIGAVVLIAFTGPELRSIGFAVALAMVGARNGLQVSQLGNIIMSSVPATRGSEAGGPAGDLDEPRRFAGHGARRLDPDRVAGDQLPDRGAGESRAHGCERRHRGYDGAKRQLRHRGAGARGRGGGGPDPGAGGCGHRGVRRRPDRGAQGGVRSGGAGCAAVALVCPPAADESRHWRSGGCAFVSG
jgi:hypothetical protein